MVESLLIWPIFLERSSSWGYLSSLSFESFGALLASSRPVSTVKVACTCRAHMVTRLNPIGAFFKIIKTRYMILVYLMMQYGQLKVRWDSPTDSSYKKLYSILPTALLSALKELNRAGEPGVMEWEERKKYFSVGFWANSMVQIFWLSHLLLDFHRLRAYDQQCNHSWRVYEDQCT